MIIKILIGLVKIIFMIAFFPIILLYLCLVIKIVQSERKLKSKLRMMILLG